MIKPHSKSRSKTCTKKFRHPRTGSASLDYVLLLGVILPLVLFLFTVVPRMIQLVYQMTVALIGSPLM